MPLGALEWNARLGRYREATGRRRLVSFARVRRDLDAALLESARRVENLALALRAGALDLISWELAMRAEVKTIQLYSAALARGGLAQLTASDLGLVGARVKAQYDYLDGFARAIAEGRQRMDGTLVRRAQLYAEAGRPLYIETFRRERVRRGDDEERSVLGVAEHCDECVAEDAAGWRPIGRMVPIGSRKCGVSDKCSVETRKSPAA